jgi:RNA polymerase sigma factor (sigma-70 family)
MFNGQTASRLVATATLTAPPGEQAATDRQLLERFVRQRDEAAFSALVRRHGPMVLGVCRRVLDNAHDAEDAFQATFLVLVRRAGSIGRPELLANWLYGVAYRTAKKARAGVLRRRTQERLAASMPRAEPGVEAAWQDLRTLLDEELQRLPDKYRAPLVLCYLEGKTNEEAARQLGWPPGSMSARLARGRELLRERLEGRRRNGLLPAPLFALLLLQKAGGADLPSRLADVTVRSALRLAAGKGAATTLVSPAVNELMEGTVRALRRARLQGTAAAVLIGASLLAAGGLVAYSVARGEVTLENTLELTQPWNGGGVQPCH